MYYSKDCTHGNSYSLPLSSDTVSHSGVYCSVSIALEQCKTEGVIDVFQVIKGVRKNKPGAVTTLVIISCYYQVISNRYNNKLLLVLVPSTSSHSDNQKLNRENL